MNFKCWPELRSLLLFITWRANFSNYDWSGNVSEYRLKVRILSCKLFLYKLLLWWWPDFIIWEHINALNPNDELFQEVRKANISKLSYKEALFLLHLQYWSLSFFDMSVAAAQSYFLNNQTQTTPLFINNNSFPPLRKLFPKVNIGHSGHSSNSSLHYNYCHLAERCTLLPRWPLLSACQQAFIRYI